MTSKATTQPQHEQLTGIFDDLRKAQGRAIEEAGTYLEASLKLSTAMVQVSHELAVSAGRRALELARTNLNDSTQKER